MTCQRTLPRLLLLCSLCHHALGVMQSEAMLDHGLSHDTSSYPQDERVRTRHLTQWEVAGKTAIEAVGNLIDGILSKKPIGPLLPSHEENHTHLPSHHHTHHPLIHPGTPRNYSDGTFQAPAIAAGPPPAGPYSVLGLGWGMKKVMQSKFEPASPCGANSPIAFRSRYAVPHQRKCSKAYNDVPVLAMLMANPGAAAQSHITALKSSIPAEWMALWDGITLETHGQGPFHGQWSKVLNGANDFLVYTKQKLGESDLADRLLKSSAARVAVLSMDAENDLPRVTRDWVTSALDLFTQNPRLAIVGMAGSKSSSGFSFTMDAGAGPWIVRRDALIESGAAGFVEFCVGTCPLSEGLAALAWTGGFQVGQLGEKVSGWPITPMQVSQGSLVNCVQMGTNSVDKAAVSGAVREAQTAFANGMATEQALAVTPVCGVFQPLKRVVRETPAVCGKANGVVKASVLIQYFKRPNVIKTLLGALKIKLEMEVLINNDSQSEHNMWLSRMGPNAFLFHSPNVHEIRGYNRLARFARGEIIVMMQDDDQPKPGDATWLLQGRDLFKAHQGLGMVGGLRGRMDVGKGHDKDTNQNDGKKYGPRFLKIYHRCPKLKIPFMFMYKVNAAPLLARRQVMMQLGGLQEAFSCPGDAGIGFDFEYSIRLWAAGYQVGLYDPKFNRPQPGKRGKAGTRADDKKWKIRRDNERLNNGLLYRTFPGFHHVRGTKLALNALNTL